MKQFIARAIIVLTVLAIISILGWFIYSLGSVAWFMLGLVVFVFAFPFLMGWAANNSGWLK